MGATPKRQPNEVHGRRCFTPVGIAPKRHRADLALEDPRQPQIGWIAHLMMGVIPAVAYAKIFLSHLPGSPVVRGGIFSLLPWLMAQIIVMPMMGMPLSSASMAMAGGSLIGHPAYGAVMGAVVGEATPRAASGRTGQPGFHGRKRCRNLPTRATHLGLVPRAGQSPKNERADDRARCGTHLVGARRLSSGSTKTNRPSVPSTFGSYG